MDSVDIERARIVAIIKEKHAKKERVQKERLNEKHKKNDITEICI